EGSPALFGAQDTFLHQSGNRAAHRVAVDGEARGQRDFGRQPIREFARRNRKPDLVRALPPERDAATPFHLSARLGHLPRLLSCARHRQALENVYNVYSRLYQETKYERVTLWTDHGNASTTWHGRRR